MSALTLNLTIINSTILNSMILSSMTLYAMILNATILNCVNKCAPTQLAHTTVPVAATITLLMTYTTAWVCDIHVLCKSYMC